MKTKILLLLFIITTLPVLAEIRFVSKSGSSTISVFTDMRKMLMLK